MNNYRYTPSVLQIKMPQTYGFNEWTEFFAWIMQVDHFAPLHTLMAHFEFLYELQITVPPTPYRAFYHDLGVQTALAGETPADQAFIDSGFYGKGIAQLIELANPENPYFDSYMEVLNIIMHQTDDCIFVEEMSLRMKAIELAGLVVGDCDKPEEN